MGNWSHVCVEEIMFVHLLHTRNQFRQLWRKWRERNLAPWSYSKIDEQDVTCDQVPTNSNAVDAELGEFAPPKPT